MTPLREELARAVCAFDPASCPGCPCGVCLEDADAKLLPILTREIAAARKAAFEEAAKCADRYGMTQMHTPGAHIAAAIRKLGEG